MQKPLLAIILVITVALTLVMAIPVHAQQQQALIISSLEKYAPTEYLDRMIGYLTQDGYNVTVVKDTAVTLNFLTTQLNNYDLVFWRTNVYEWYHVTYWYVGELTNKATTQVYSQDFAKGYLDGTNAIIGVSINFLVEHFPRGSLSRVKLAVLESSISANIANVFLTAGVKGTVDYYQTFSLQFSDTDGFTAIVLAYLTSGLSLQNAVWQTITPYITQHFPDPTEQIDIPPVWYMGNATLTIP